MNRVLQSSDVAICAGHSHYGGPAPYSPARSWPEYPFAVTTVAMDANPAYDAVRCALLLLGLDKSNQGKGAWNPLGEVIRRGDMVVLKPNFVREFRDSHADHANCVMTHGAVIRAVLDYVFIALHGEGRIVIADAPQNDADFGSIRRIAGLDEIQAFYRENVDFKVEVYDLRPERAEKIDGVIVGHVPLPGDPAGYVKVNLGLHSGFVEVNHLCHLLYGSEYEMSELHSHHHDDVHEYLISKTILDADVVVSLPKLKTHKKVGLTANLKNMVGINGNKNWLPHHREGSPAQGGDQFAENGAKHRIERIMMSRFKRWFPRLGPLRSVVAGPAKALGKRMFGDTNTDTIRSGNWYGNDTTWRMVLDLNRVLLYADAKGVLQQQPVRRFFSVVDGIVAGEGNGPLDPTPKKAGVVLAGMNPVAVDAGCAQVMAFDYRWVPMLARAFDCHPLLLIAVGPSDILTISNDRRLTGLRDSDYGRPITFAPHFGWRQHIEMTLAGTSPVDDGPRDRKKASLS